MAKLPNKSHAQKQMDYNANPMNPDNIANPKAANNRANQTNSNSNQK